MGAREEVEEIAVPRELCLVVFLLLEKRVVSTCVVVIDNLGSGSGVMLSLIYFLMLDFDLEEPTPINPLRCISEKKEQGIMSKKKEEPTRISNTEVFIPPKSTATFDPFSPGRMEGSLVGRAVTDRSTESPILGQEGKSRNCVSERGKYVSFCF